MHTYIHTYILTYTYKYSYTCINIHSYIHYEYTYISVIDLWEGLTTPL